MARKPRLFIAGMPYHVVQRGNNKTQIYFSDIDYLFFLRVLKEAKDKYPCLIHAYCLMPNHFHLLIRPIEKKNVSLLIKLLGAKYVRYVNKKYNRTGTLWEGRFKASLIDEESYFLACLNYIETNPIRAALTDSLDSYPWSSYRAKAFGGKDANLDIDEWYKSLGDTSERRQSNYINLIRNSLPKPASDLIRKMTKIGGVVGSQNFKEKIERISGEKLIFNSRGRPLKDKK